MANSTTELATLSHLQFSILFDALHAKGLLSYADMQEAISRFRGHAPKGALSPFITANLNMMEQQFQAGRYQSPIPAKGDPERP